MGPELDNDCRRTGCMTLTEKYIRYVDTVKRYSPKTVRTYHDILDDFVTYAFNGSGPVSSGCSRGDTVIPDNEMMEILTPGMIRSYEVYLMDTRKVIPRTVNLHLSVLSGFCRFLIKEGLLTYNPVRTVARPKMPKRLPAVFRQASIAKYFRDTEIFVDVPPDISPEDFMAQYIASRPRGYREEADPVLITRSEFMRRMKDMAAIQPGMAIYGELPDSYNLIVNTEHPLTQRIIADTESSCKEQLTPILDELNTVNAEITRLQEAKKDKKDEEIPVADKEALKSAEEKAKELRSKESDVLKTYADKNPLVRQLVDLALLSNNMLKGEALNNFIKRSVDIL